MLYVAYSTPSDGALEASHSAAASEATPTSATRRGPKRSAAIPPGAPSANQRNAATENTSAMCPREAPNSASSAPKNAANEYAAPKPTNINVKAAATTTQPYFDGSVNEASDATWIR